MVGWVERIALSPSPLLGGYANGQASLRHAALTPTGIQETRSVSALDIVKPNKGLIFLVYEIFSQAFSRTRR